MLMQGAEITGETFMIFRAYGLVSEYQNQMFTNSGFNLGQSIFWKWLA